MKKIIILFLVVTSAFADPPSGTWSYCKLRDVGGFLYTTFGTCAQMVATDEAVCFYGPDGDAATSIPDCNLQN